MTEKELRNTPLFECHLAFNARMVPFAGWNMPVQYEEGIIKEHLHTRKAVSVFDISHMGEFTVRGRNVAAELDRILARPVLDQKTGSCRYNFLLSEQGTVADDLIVYRLAEDDFYIVVNAGTKDSDANIIRQRLSCPECFSDISDATAKIDVQGPLSGETMAEIGICREKLPKYYHWVNAQIQAVDCLVSRTGYTGELGFEIYLPAEHAQRIWQLLLRCPNVKPAGLGARDTLRLEMGYALYGHELDLETTPVDAGYGGMLKLDTDRVFIGKKALVGRAPEKRLRGLLLQSRQAAREHTVVMVDGQQVGIVTSGAFAPSLGRAVALAYIQENASLSQGDSVSLDTGRKLLDAVVTDLPFYREGTARKAI